MLEPGLIESDAFRDLSGKSAMLTLIRFHQKAYKKRKDGRKRGLKDLVVTNKGTNTLTNNGADEENAIIAEGAQSAKFVAASHDYMAIADADLDAGFPWRYNDGAGAEKTFSIFLRLYLNSLPGASEWQTIISKLAYPTEMVFAPQVHDSKLEFVMGYNNGESTEEIAFGTAFQTGRWYSIGVTYNADDYGYRIRIYDHTAEDFLDSDSTGNFANATFLDNAPLSIGRNTGQAEYLNGVLDEIAVFNRVLSVSEIDDIRAGTFS